VRPDRPGAGGRAAALTRDKEGGFAGVEAFTRMKQVVINLEH
jgi:hypothetical protein